MFFSLKFLPLNQFNGVQWRQRPSSFMIDLNVVTPGYKQICSGLNANEIQIPNDKHREVSSLIIIIMR